MANYQKVLQLYRSTNIWDTKNQAKAEVEIHAKQLHGEFATMLKDGEPIIAKYYDFAEGYFQSFSYSPNLINEQNTDPYSVGTSATHVWFEGFDSFKSNEFDTTSGKIKGVSPNYDSPAYIRVGENNGYTYYRLVITPVSEQSSISRTESAVFGVALIDTNTNGYYIEWFDSAAEAKGAITALNYNDKDLTKGFVAKVNQKDGKIEAIHGDITGENATVVTDNQYHYVKLTNETVIPTVIPVDYIWDDTNTGTELGAASESAPKYYHVTTGEGEGYYELRKNISVTLLIGDNNNILYQDNHGFKTNINLRHLNNQELGQLSDASNVKEAFKLVGAADGTEKQIGEIIKIYKDSSLYGTYVGTTSDTFLNGTLKTPQESKVYKWVNGNDSVYTLEKDDIEQGDKAYHEGSADFVFTGPADITDIGENTITVDGVEYTLVSETEYSKSVPFVVGGDSTNESLSFVYILADGTYELVNVDIENFLQESEFGDGLIVDNHIVKVRLASDGGIDFETEQTGNKSLKIKIDGGNQYYEQLPNSTGATHRYDPTNTSAASYDNGYVVVSEASASATGYYKKDTYLHTTANGLSIDEDVLENKITDNIDKVLYVNGQKFVKDGNGDIKAVINGEQITVAGNSSTDGDIDMTTVTEVETLQNPTASSPEYVEYRGLIYKLTNNGVNYSYELFFIDKDTNLNDAIAIINYLTYNLDMGQFTIQ